jgi:hypothetical protein
MGLLAVVAADAGIAAREKTGFLANLIGVLKKARDSRQTRLNHPTSAAGLAVAALHSASGLAAARGCAAGAGSAAGSAGVAAAAAVTAGTMGLRPLLPPECFVMSQARRAARIETRFMSIYVSEEKGAIEMEGSVTMADVREGVAGASSNSEAEPWSCRSCWLGGG